MTHLLDPSVCPSVHPSGRVDEQATVEDPTFVDARDVAALASHGALLKGRPNCESWHLDRSGRFVCGTNGTASDSLGEWAENPDRLVKSFLEFRAKGTCTPNWIVVEERPKRSAVFDPTPGELDVERFIRLRSQLEVAGITLLDAVIFADGDRWWSMCELLTGTSRWGRRPFPKFG